MCTKDIERLQRDSKSVPPDSESITLPMIYLLYCIQIFQENSQVKKYLCLKNKSKIKQKKTTHDPLIDKRFSADRDLFRVHKKTSLKNALKTLL